MLPRSWLKVEWVDKACRLEVNAQSAGQRFEDRVVTNPDLFNWIRHHVHPNLTTSQYRTAVKRLVKFPGPGYAMRSDQLEPELREILLEAIDSLGNRGWACNAVVSAERRKAKENSQAATEPPALPPPELPIAATPNLSQSVTSALRERLHHNSNSNLSVASNMSDLASLTDDLAATDTNSLLAAMAVRATTANAERGEPFSTPAVAPPNQVDPLPKAARPLPELIAPPHGKRSSATASVLSEFDRQGDLDETTPGPATPQSSFFSRLNPLNLVSMLYSTNSAEPFDAKAIADNGATAATMASASTSSHSSAEAAAALAQPLDIANATEPRFAAATLMQPQPPQSSLNTALDSVYEFCGHRTRSVIPRCLSRDEIVCVERFDQRLREETQAANGLYIMVSRGRNQILYCNKDFVERFGADRSQVYWNLLPKSELVGMFLAVVGRTFRFVGAGKYRFYTNPDGYDTFEIQRFMVNPPRDGDPQVPVHLFMKFEPEVDAFIIYAFPL